MNELEKKRKVINIKINQIETKKAEITKQTEKLKNLHMKLNQIQKRQGITERAQEKYTKVQQSCFKGFLQSAKDRKILIQSILDQSEKLKVNEIKLHIFKLQNANIENIIASAKEALANSTTLFDTIRSSYERSKVTYNNKKTKVLEMCDNKNPDHDDFPYKEKFSSLTNDIQQLNDEINDIQARVECMVSENSNVIEEFESRQKEIERLGAVIMEGLQNTTETQNKISVLHNKWYPKIKDTVAEINKYFGDFMRSMQYVGEVQLIHDEDVVSNINLTI